MEKIFILGNGAMASAMAYGLRDKYDVTLVGRNTQRLKNLKEDGFSTELYGEKFDINDKKVILAFKPYALKSVAEKLIGKSDLLISVLATSSIDDVKECINSNIYIKAMPNIAAKFKSSITPFCSQNDNINDAVGILSTFGEVCRVDNENELNIAMAISGCAPAYLAVVSESMACGVVSMGLKKDIAHKLTAGVFKSISSLLKDSHPAFIKESVCSPAGTTIAGVDVLEECAVRSAFIKAIKASVGKVKK